MDSASPKKRALLIGIEYRNVPDMNSLPSAPEEAKELRSLLMKQYDYTPQDIVVLTDRAKNPLRLPTRENILREIDNLVADARAGDQFVFHFSGHCDQLPRDDGTEEDGLDETLEALDGYILDDTLKERLVDPLPAGCTLVAILDTCHSETLLDLPHYHCNRLYLPYSNDREPSVEEASDPQLATWRKQKLYKEQRTRGLRHPRYPQYPQYPHHHQGPPKPFPKPRSALVNPKNNLNKPSLSLKVPRSSSMLILSDGTQCYDSPVAMHMGETHSPLFIESPYRSHHPCCPPTPGLPSRYKPTVIAISAAKDSQESFVSITRAICKVLRKYTEISLGELLTHVSYMVYKECRKRSRTKEFKQTNPEPRNIYSHPSVSSLSCLDPRRIFIL